MLDKIKNFIGNKSNVDVTISLKEFDVEYAVSLDNSIADAESGQPLIFFTMEDFMTYNPSK